MRRSGLQYEIYVRGKLFGSPTRYYAGDRLWACNPGLTAFGWFDLSDNSRLNRRPRYRGVHPSSARGRDLRLRVRLTIVDALEREHQRLPVDWYYDWQSETWASAESLYNFVLQQTAAGGLLAKAYVPGELFIAPDQILAGALAVLISSYLGVWKRIRTNFVVEGD